MGNKQVILLTGASGSMGFEAFKLLWEKRDRYDIVLFLRPSKKNRKKFRLYEHQAEQEGLKETKGFKIVWGDVLNREDVVEAIEAENPEHIKLVHVGTVAEYGDRLPPVHVCRTGDPVMPSVFDHYAISKVKGELAVMQSRIKHKVSLRQTFIMIPDLLSLKDPIMFHQAINSYMENITARDSGRLLVKCLEQRDDSDFWGGYYNISGGPGCRIVFMELLQGIYIMLGIRHHKVMERKWFALKNFHMAFYEDSSKLNDYLHHWEGGQNLEDYYREVWKNLPWYLKATARYAKYIPPYRWLVEAATRGQLKKLTYKPDGTMGWIEYRDTGRINAFYGSMEAYNKIPGWDGPMPSLDHSQAHTRLDHGYDEAKAELELMDLRQAAAFRGGNLVSKEWSGNMHQQLSWLCCQKHSFEMSPHSILKGGHWCLDCISPPWDYSLIAQKNPFASQALKPGIK